MKKRLFTLCFALTAMCASTMAQFITEENFPDPNFRKFLIENIDGIKGDRFLSDSEKNAVTDLNVSNLGIKDLTGIQYFTNLETIYCYGNEISGVNMYKLVNLLPAPSSILGGLAINYNGCSPDNVITKAQAEIAASKGWLTVRCLNDEDIELYDGEDVAVSAKFFPDTKFRSLVAAYDTDKDNILSDDELNVVTALDVKGQGITALTGIEYFYNLQTLNCGNNSLTALDVSMNQKLTELRCYYTGLKSLDVSNNTALIYLECQSNSFESLDVSANTALQYLDCQNTGLKSLDVSNNKELFYLDCSDNSLTSVDVLNNTKLGKLDCSYNSLESLDVSKNTALRTLYCSNNRLKSLDVSKNTELLYLRCYGNQISGAAMTSLVNSLRSLVSVYTDAFFYVCSDKVETDNIITAAQVKIATDKLWRVKKYDSDGNAVDYAGVEKVIKINETNFPDVKFRNILLTEDYGLDGILTDAEILTVTELNLTNRGIKDLTGIEHFTNMTKLDCSFNRFESLDFSKNPALKELNCSMVGLTSLDVSKNTALEILYCGNNHLTSLDVSKNTALIWLDCGFNRLTSLDVSQNTALKKLGCDGNQIRGAAMASLVNSLRSLPYGTDGEFKVCYDLALTDNIITAAQVKVAVYKGWTVKKINNFGVPTMYAGQGDVNGDNKIDQDDFDTIVNIIMGLADFANAGDLNSDEMTDAADVVIMLNILKSLGK